MTASYIPSPPAEQTGETRRTRDPGRIDPILANLRRYWHAHPDLRLGQIVVNAMLGAGARYNASPFYTEDDHTARYLAEQCADLPPPAPPDLAKIRELVGALGALARQPGASDDEVEAAEDAILAAIAPAPVPTGERGDAGSQSLALRNCLALARAKMRNPNRPGGWEDVVRFCGAAGVAPDVLRAEPTGERVPSARWAARHGSLWFAVGDYRAQVMEHGGWTLWLVNPSSGGGWVARADGEETGSAAQLAAEDALLAVRDEITRAVGRSE